MKIVTDSVSANVTNTIPTNMTGNVSINFINKKLRRKVDYYNLHTVLILVTQLFITVILCYHYARHRSKQETFFVLII